MTNIVWFAAGGAATIAFLWLARKIVRTVRRFIGGDHPEEACQRTFLDHELSAD